MNAQSFKYELGSQVEDQLTGYKGTIIARTQWLTGCNRYTVQAKELKDGKPVEAIGIDEEQIHLVEAARAPAPRERGGPAPAVTQSSSTPSRRSDPSR